MVAVRIERDGLTGFLAGRGVVVDGQAAQGDVRAVRAQRGCAEGAALHAVFEDLARAVAPDDARAPGGRALERRMAARKHGLFAVYAGREADDGGRAVLRQAIERGLQGSASGADGQDDR